MQRHAVAKDIITYNTLLKGYCNKNDIKGAKEESLGVVVRFDLERCLTFGSLGFS